MTVDAIRNVLVVSRFYAPMQNTRAIQAERAVAALRDSGLDVRVISEGKDSFSPGGRVNRFIAEVGLYLNWTGLAWHGARKSKARAFAGGWRPDVVLSMSTPFDSHLLGHDLANTFGVPWAVFLSDPWPVWTAPGPYSGNRNSLYHMRQFACAKRLLSECDALLAPTDEMTQLLRQVYPELSETPAMETLHCLSPPAPDRTTAEPSGIYHIGQITRERCSDALIAAIKKLGESLRGEKGVLNFVGDVANEIQEALSHEVESGVVRFHPPVDAQRSRELMRTAQALLLIEADMDASPFLPSKITDYAAAQRPMLIISNPDSALVRIAGGHAGVHCAPHDAALIAQELLAVYQEPQETAAELASEFSPDEIAARYMQGLQLAMQHFSAG